MSRKNISSSEISLSNVGGRIRLIRVINDLSIEDFARRIKISKGNLSEIEHSKYEPSYKVIVRIIEQFKVNSNWLVLGKGSMNEHQIKEKS